MACMDCFGGGIEQDSIEEKVIDLEKLILNVAWKLVKKWPPAQLTRWERLCPLASVVKLEVDKTMLHVQPSSKMSFTPNMGLNVGDMDIQKCGDTDEQKGDKGVKSVMLSSKYTNDTGIEQLYLFKTERQTNSSMELSLQQGFTLGSSLEMDMKIPMVGSGKFGMQSQWSFQRGKTTRQEDTMTWSVESQVKVAEGQTCIACMKVTERQWKGNFTIPCHIIPLTEDRKIPVFVRRKNTGYLLQDLRLRCSAVVDGQVGDKVGGKENYFKLYDPKDTQNGEQSSEQNNGPYIWCELQGVCHTLCAVEPVVSLGIEP